MLTILQEVFYRKTSHETIYREQDFWFRQLIAGKKYKLG